MTPDAIEQQARREAEAKYPTHFGQRESWAEHIATFEREAYAAALVAERSKPQPSVEEVMAIVGPLCLGEATERHITDRLTKLFNK